MRIRPTNRVHCAVNLHVAGLDADGLDVQVRPAYHNRAVIQDGDNTRLLGRTNLFYSGQGQRVAPQNGHIRIGFRQIFHVIMYERKRFCGNIDENE